MSPNDVDFQKAKDDINISDFALSNGYVKNNTKSTKKYLILDHADGDTICVFRHQSGVELFFNPKADEKGDLLLFIKNRLDKFQNLIAKNDFDNLQYGIRMSEWGQVSRIIKNYNPAIQRESFHFKEEETIGLKIFHLAYYNAKKLYDYSYLEKRGFEVDFLQSSKFTGRIFNNEYNGKINVLFPTFHLDEIRGVSIRGEGLKMNGKNSDLSHSFWHTNYDKSKSIEAIIVGESPLDVMSYLQIKYYDKGKNKFEGLNVMGISIDGSVREYLHYFVNSLPKNYNTKIILVNDNDVPGYLHDIKIVKKINSNFPLEPIYLNMKAPELQFRHINDNGTENIISVKNDTDSFKELLSQYKNELIKRGIVIDKPMTKDWNDHLIASKKTIDFNMEQDFKIKASKGLLM